MSGGTRTVVLQVATTCAFAALVAWVWRTFAQSHDALGSLDTLEGMHFDR